MSANPAILLLAAVAALIVLGLSFAWLVRTYRTPTGPERVVALLLGLLVAEAALYENPNNVPTGLFHPQAGPLSFRIFDVLVPLAVVAYFASGARVRRAFPAQVPLWCAFLLWLALSGVAGIFEGNSSGLVAFHAKAIIYLGTFALVALVPPRRWLESRPLHRVIAASSVLAALLIVLSESGTAINLSLPLVPLVGFGVLGSDAATIFVVLGTGVLCVALCSDHGRLRLFTLALPLLAAPLVAGQRAAMLGLVVAVGAALLLVPLSPRNVRLRPSDVVLVALAVVGLLMAIVLIDAVRGDAPSLPLAAQIQETFQSRGKQLSEQDRINQWAQASSLISERPWFGWGLGKEYEYYSPGFFEFMRTDITHNITTDLLLRTGIVGLLLFAVAVLASLRDALLGWARELDARVAALSLAVFCSLSGLIVKGLVESLFEKYRLAVVIGGLVGVSVAVAATRLAPADAPASSWSAGRSGSKALAR